MRRTLKRVGESILKTTYKHTFKHTLSALVLATSVLILDGCATTPAPKAYEVRANADAIINRDITGQPLSVVVRLYQLKQAKEFNTLTFDLATSNRTDAELFGESLIQRTELLLVPGTTHISTQALAPETKYLGVVAFFRRPDAHYWRFLIDANQVRSNGLSFQALDCYLQLKNTLVTPIPGQPSDAKPACLGENVAVPNATPSTTTPHPHANVAPAEPPKRVIRTRPTTTSNSPATNTVPRALRPTTPLPAPPVPTVQVQVPTPSAAPAVNINVSPNLSLPKWGGQ